MQNQDTIGDSYNTKVANSIESKQVRKSSEMSWIKSFNNWIKAVLINKYCTLRSNEVRKALDLRSNTTQKTLHVLDIGCGHGQDIGKWGKNSVAQIVGVDVSDKALDTYVNRWKTSELYDFTPIHMSASNPELYRRISGSYYDIVSAQLSLHYLFGSQKEVRETLKNALQNLLEGGYMVLTIPDSCSIVKKMRTFGKKEGGYYMHGNKYYSMRFQSLDFSRENGSFGLKYGFYLKEAIGSKDSSNEIEYWDEYLIELGAFERILKEYGMEVLESKNFLEFYKENLAEYKDLLVKMELIFGQGQSMSEDFWEVAHLYRVFTARKTTGTSHYSLSNRNEDRKKAEYKANTQRRDHHHSYSNNKDRRGGGGGFNRGGYNNYNNNPNYNNHHSNSNFHSNSNNRRGRGDGGHNNYSQPKRKY